MSFADVRIALSIAHWAALTTLTAKREGKCVVCALLDGLERFHHRSDGVRWGVRWGNA